MACFTPVSCTNQPHERTHYLLSLTPKMTSGGESTDSTVKRAEE